MRLPVREKPETDMNRTWSTFHVKRKLILLQMWTCRETVYSPVLKVYSTLRRKIRRDSYRVFCLFVFLNYLAAEHRELSLPLLREIEWKVQETSSQ